MTTAEILQSINEMIKFNLSFEDHYCLEHVIALQDLFFDTWRTGAGASIKLLEDQYKMLFEALPEDDSDVYAGRVIQFIASCNL